MSRKQLSTDITSAMDAASRQAMREAIGKLPPEATLGSLLNQLGASRPGSILRSTPLGELAALLSANGDAPPTRVGRAPKRKKAKRTVKRTPTGSVRTYLRKAGKAKAEEIRADVGGTPAEVRQKLFELKDEKLVRRTGKGRATTWHWRS